MSQNPTFAERLEMRRREQIEMRRFMGRRHYAGIALRAILASDPDHFFSKNISIAADRAFEWADAMLAAEEKDTTK